MTFPLSGRMPVPENSSLAPLTWIQRGRRMPHSLKSNSSKVHLRQLQKLHGWQATYLPESAQPKPVCFYMFSGPDFLYVDQFFPRRRCTCLRKRSSGPAADPLRIANLSGALGNLENAMKSSLNTTYSSHKYEVDCTRRSERRAADSLHLHRSRDKSITTSRSDH